MYIHPKHKRQTEKNLPQLMKQATPWFGVLLATSGQGTQWTLFLQPWSPHQAPKSKPKERRQ